MSHIHPPNGWSWNRLCYVSALILLVLALAGVGNFLTLNTVLLAAFFYVLGAVI